MKKIISIALVSMLAISGAIAKDVATTSKRVTAKGDNVSITYGQASRNGQVIFGKTSDNAQIPNGTLWCTGDGKVAQVTINKNCRVGGNKVPLKAGTYSLYTRPCGGEWVFMFNTQLNQSGIASFNADKTVCQTWALVKHLGTPVEQFTVTPQNGGLLMEWDTQSVLLPVEFDSN